MNEIDRERDSERGTERDKERKIGREGKLVIERKRERERDSVWEKRERDRQGEGESPKRYLSSGEMISRTFFLFLIAILVSL